jgi:hypothetical protein
MANGWTVERRLRQQQGIKAWKPWEQSTGPRSKAGKAKSSRNAWKGGSRIVFRHLARILRNQT